MKVAEVMNRDVASCSVDANLDVAAQIMWERRVGSVIVLSGDRLVGVLTDRDVAMAAQTQGRPLKEIPIAVAMAAELATCAPEDSVRDALMRMKERRVRRCPVIDESGALLGLVSLDDLARAASRRRQAVDRRELAAAFAATAAAGPVEAPGSDQVADEAADRGMTERLSVLAGEVSHRARHTWDNVRQQARRTWEDLEQDRPGRGRAGAIGSRVVRAIARAPGLIRRRGSPQGAPPPEPPAQEQQPHVH